MKLRVLVPWGVELDAAVGRVRGESVAGSFTLLPRHVDTVAILAQGLLSATTPEGREIHVAVDGGTLVKVGDEVLVATPEAVVSDSLDELRTAIEVRFRERDEHQRRARTVLDRIGSDIVQRLVELEEMTQRGR